MLRALDMLVGLAVVMLIVSVAVTTVVQIVFVLGELLRLSHWIEMPQGVRNAAIVVTAALTVASGVHYVLVWSARAWRTRSVARGRQQP